MDILFWKNASTTFLIISVQPKIISFDELCGVSSWYDSSSPHMASKYLESLGIHRAHDGWEERDQVASQSFSRYRLFHTPSAMRAQLVGRTLTHTFWISESYFGNECGWVNGNHREKQKVKRTFPNPSPQNISIVDIHHNPLPVQRILVYGSAMRVVSDQRQSLRELTTHIYPRGSLLVM